jgi:predicted small lipoprotein YifL
MRAAHLLLEAITLLPLAACGKKGPPSPPGPPNEIIYPRTYPTR